MNGTLRFLSAVIFFSVIAAVSNAAHLGIRESGDVNCDDIVNLSDAVALQDFLFNGGDLCCPEVSDVNNDGIGNVSDVVYLLDYLFDGGPAPAGLPAICRE